MISLIVPLYVNHQSLYPIINRFFESIPRGDIEVVVVEDGSPLPIMEEWPDMADIWITKSLNEGFTKTVNRGLKEATGNILVISNDDLVLTEELLKRFENIEDGIYSPKTSDEGEGDLFGSIWGMTRSVYEKLGGLDDRLLHFYSDKEYYARAKKAGIKIVKWYDIVIEHEGGSTYKNADKDKLYLKDDQTYSDLYRGIAA